MQSTEAAMIEMLDRHGERQATATREGMTAIARELRDIRADQQRMANRMLLLVGAVVLVAIVMMAGLVRATYLTASLDGVTAGSGASYRGQQSPTETPREFPQSPPDEAPQERGGHGEATPEPFIVPTRREEFGNSTPTSPALTLTLIPWR